VAHMSMNVKESLSAAIETKLRGDFRSAKNQIEAALIEARRVKDRWGEAQCLLELGGIDIHFYSDYENGKKRFEESLSLYTSLRSNQGRAYAMNGLAHVARGQGDVVRARTLLSQSLTLFEEARDKSGEAAALHEMGLLDEQAGDSTSAEACLRRSLLILESLGNKPAVGQILLSLGSLKVRDNKLEQAQELFSRSLALFEELGLKSEADKARHNLAYVKSKML
jgi:tetratricopeptide (TPR) repeat protein